MPDETPIPVGIFPDLSGPNVAVRFDPNTQCLRCFGPLGFELVTGRADACSSCTGVLARAEGLTTIHIRRYVVALAHRYHFPLPA